MEYSDIELKSLYINFEVGMLLPKVEATAIFRIYETTMHYIRNKMGQ